MPAATNAEALREWLRTCPAISDQRYFRVDYLAEDPIEYAIYTVPSSIAYRRDILGNVYLADIQTENYIFAVRADYSADFVDNLANLGFFNAVLSWIAEQNAVKNFPEISAGMVCEIVPTVTGAPIQFGSASARYQIQLQLKYRRSS